MIVGSKYKISERIRCQNVKTTAISRLDKKRNVMVIEIYISFQNGDFVITKGFFE